MVEMSAIMNAAVGSIAIVSFLLVCAVKKRKMKMSQLMDALSDPYFKPTKQLTIKDEVFISMLECCQNKGPCYVITDPSLRDNPIIYASKGFTQYTGYAKEEVEGRNCRFLQGKDTCPLDISRIRKAIANKEEVSVCLLNYRKNGTTFLNQFFLTPLYGDDGQVAYYIGVQAAVESKEHYPGKERINAGWKMLRYFESNITDQDVAAHSK